MSKRVKLDVLTRSSRQKNCSVGPASTVDTEASRFFKNENDVKIETDDSHPKKKKSSRKQKSSPDNGKAATNCTPKTEPTHPDDESLSKDNKSWFPKNWEETLKNIRIMRQHRTAPVDDMGCDKCADDEAPGPISRYQTLLSLMLSSQTKDQVTHAAMQRLREIKCTPENIVKISEEELGKRIYPVGFWKRKVQYLKSTSKILLEKYNGDIPNNIKELCDLPGVGPKMAHICMQVAWNETTGIGVDTHVHRISNRLKWVPKPTKTPEGTRIALEAWLPKEIWSEVNHLLVGFGQEICQPQRPKCAECLNRTICPSADKNYQF
ncbi:hypothetical protein QAD02_019452 [Eretmocerus hayati]|uniref:Uncharacterized protein n=1 Tax=Eretmocerus hayati TaxID=131215 RepID=A0ACC2PJQ6_9HYME|nr:hypothetical protein QAD02_019452 [Eretmocerus hayati]